MRARGWYGIGMWSLMVALGVTFPAGSSGESVESLVKAGQAAMDDGLHDVARQQFEAALERADAEGGAGRDDVLLLLLKALEAQGGYLAIRETLDRRVRQGRLDAEGATAVFWRALVLNGTGRYDDALRLLDESAGTLEKDRLYGGRSERLRAWCHLKTGRTNEALQAFARFDRADPGSAEAALNCLEWARVLASVGKKTEAGDVLESALRTRGDAPVAQDLRLALGQLLLDTGRVQEGTNLLYRLVGSGDTRRDVKSEAWWVLARHHEKVAQPAAAMDALNAVLVNARSPALRRRASYELGFLMLEGGRTEEASVLLKRTISEAPEDPLAGTGQLRIAESLANGGKFESAAQEFQHYVETFTNVTGQVRAYQGKGWALLRGGRFTEAALAFGKAYAMTRDPSIQSACLFKVGDSFFANSQFNMASDAYARVVSEFPTSSVVPQAMFQLAESVVRAGDGAQGENLFRALAIRFPDSPLAEEALLRVADEKRLAGRLTEALNDYTLIMTRYPKGAGRSRALLSRGLVYFNLFRFGEAMADFQAVQGEGRGGDTIEQASYMGGLCLFWMGDDEKALASFRHFLQKFPESRWAADGVFWIAEHEYNRGTYDVAEKEFLRFSERYPQHVSADSALLRAGMSASRRNEFLRSIEIMTRMIKDYPQSPRIPEARFEQGVALAELGKFAEAILIFDEIITKYPVHDLIPATWGRKGDCQFNLGAENPKRYEESLESYRIVANSAKSPLDMVLQAAYKMGRSLEKMGRSMDAFQQYYLKVILRYSDEREKAGWHDEASKVWFTKAAFNAADIMGSAREWKKEVAILGRVVEAGVPGAGEAKARIEKIQSEKWWLFID